MLSIGRKLRIGQSVFLDIFVDICSPKCQTFSQTYIYHKLSSEPNRNIYLCSLSPSATT